MGGTLAHGQTMAFMVLALCQIVGHTYDLDVENMWEYMESLQVGEAEYELIHSALRGTCLFRCGNERYLLQVIAPDHKSKLFGTAGGR